MSCHSLVRSHFWLWSSRRNFGRSGMAAHFLSVRLADRSGELDGKAWDNPEAVAQLFDCDDVVKVRGTIDHYNDRPQLIVSRIRRCEPNEYNAADFFPASNRDPEEMFGELAAFVAMVRDESLRELLESIMNDGSISQQLKTAPAAMKIHHAFRAGLLEHIVSLCNLPLLWPRTILASIWIGSSPEPFFTTWERSKRSR